MKFCKKCKNKIFLTDYGNEKKYYCNICNLYSDDEVGIINNKLYKSKYSITNKLYSMIHDITYPTINQKCLNPKCDNKLIVYSKQKNMTNIYLCRKCKSFSN